MKPPYPYFKFFDSVRHEQLKKRRYYGPFPFDDNAAFGIQNHETKVVIIRNVNFCTAERILDEIEMGMIEGR